MNDRLIIGLSGTNGAGKDAVAAILAQKYNFLFAGATEMFVKELNARGLPTTRENKAMLSAEWRRESGMGVVVDKGLATLEAADGQYEGLVVSSLRHPGEADRVHELDGIVIWIDADPAIRYQRIRSANRGREAEDNKTFEEFQAEELREMTPSGDAATLNMLGVKERADVTLMNNGTNLAELDEQLSSIMAGYNKT